MTNITANQFINFYNDVWEEANGPNSHVTLLACKNTLMRLGRDLNVPVSDFLLRATHRPVLFFEAIEMMVIVLKNMMKSSNEPVRIQASLLDAAFRQDLE